MEYRLEINQKLLSAALSQTQGQGPSFSASLKGIHDGETRHDIEVRRISNHQLHLMVDGHRFNAWVERIDGGKIILLDGERYVIYDKDLAAQNHTPSTA
ncbi:MAG: hypothetical protein MI747_18780, partial [Desulfobacterales bacterium]|nr:hypothetical protein [Desulfobacterales bacterium]